MSTTPDGSIAAGSPLDLPAAPADALRIESGWVSHPGRVRSENEDRCLIAVESGIFAVADGMGGHADGALASATVIEALASIGISVSAPDMMARLEDRILRANAHLRSESEARGIVIGSTVAVLLIFGQDYACVWSGDSRIYRIRDAAIQQLTRDHTEGRALFEGGVLSAEEMETWPRRHVITRAIGVRDQPEVDLEQGSLRADDVFVLCSDGLTGHVADRDILLAASTSAPQWACDALLDLTLERGATDNVTIVIIRCRNRGGQEASGPEASASGSARIQSSTGGGPR